MEYRELGNTGIKVSEIAFGAAFCQSRKKKNWLKTENLH